MRSRWAARTSRRSALVSWFCLRRRLASAAVIGAGAIGARRLASRLGVGRPFGAVVLLGQAESSACKTASVDSSVLPFLRPSRLTSSAYFDTTPDPACACRCSALSCTNDGPGELMRVLIAPDCFGGSLSAVEAAEAIAAGWRKARPNDTLTRAPQSDGGPGFVDVIASRLGQRRTLRVRGPLDADVGADWVFDSVEPSSAYLESAQACGLDLLDGPPTPQTATAAHTTGVGQLIAAALDEGAALIVVGLGGSASTDGGRGMAEALGGLQRARDRLAGIELIAATDVEHPLLGPMGA